MPSPYLALLLLCTRTVLTVQLLKRKFLPTVYRMCRISEIYRGRTNTYARERGTRNSHDWAVMPEQLHNVNSRLSRILRPFSPESIFPRKLAVCIHVENAKVATKVLAICIIYWVQGWNHSYIIREKWGSWGTTGWKIVGTQNYLFLHFGGPQNLIYPWLFLETHPTWQIARYLRTLAMHEFSLEKIFK